MTTKKPATKQATTKKVKGKKPEPAKLTPEETKAKIAELLNRLKAASLIGEKKAIRRQLRAHGHTGGLGKATR